MNHKWKSCAFFLFFFIANLVISRIMLKKKRGKERLMNNNLSYTHNKCVRNKSLTQVALLFLPCTYNFSNFFYAISTRIFHFPTSSYFKLLLAGLLYNLNHFQLLFSLDTINRRNCYLYMKTKQKFHTYVKKATHVCKLNFTRLDYSFHTYFNLQSIFINCSQRGEILYAGTQNRKLL